MKEKELYQLRNLTVCKSNAMIQKSRFTLSLQQQKMMLFIISKINWDDTDLQWYDISLPEFCDIAGTPSNGQIYTELKSALKTLRDKSMWIQSDDGKREILVSWLQSVILDYDKNIVRVKLDDTLKPFLLQLKDHYTQYELSWALRFNSKYSIRLYEYIKSMQYDDSKPYTWTVKGEDLKERMGGEQYERFFDFKKRALLPSVQEINQYSDKSLVCDIKRAIDGEFPEVVFTVSTKPKDEIKAIRASNEDKMNGSIGLSDDYNKKKLEESKARKQKKQTTSKTTKTSNDSADHSLPDTVVIKRK